MIWLIMNCELFFRDCFLETSHRDCELLKSRLEDLVFHLSKLNSSNKLKNLTPEEFESLLNLSKNKTVVIQKSDKDNPVFSLIWLFTLMVLKKLLTNPRQFPKCSIEPNKELDVILNCEQKVIEKIILRNFMACYKWVIFHFW